MRTEGVTKLYRGAVTPAVDGLDLSVRRGEIFGLLGPNGAGKTTTVGMLTTRVIPTGGRAFVAGIDVAASPTRVKQVIGVVPQINTLDRSLTVRENLYFHGRYFGMTARTAGAAADHALARFRLTARAAASVETLSGGMAQRLMLARAIMHQPAVLFLDEPTSGLDPQSRLVLWDLLRELHAGGQTTVLTTHQMEEADQLCDRVAIMDKGRILALGTPGELKRSLGVGVEVTVRGEGDFERLVEHLRSVAGARDGSRTNDSITVHLGSPDGALAEVLAVAQRTRFTLTDVSIREPSLETVFIHLTGRELRE